MILIAAVAVAVSGAAFAKDLKGSVMTNSEMDKVTAGGNPGYGAEVTQDGRYTYVWVTNHQGTNCHGPGC